MAEYLSNFSRIDDVLWQLGHHFLDVRFLGLTLAGRPLFDFLLEFSK